MAIYESKHTGSTIDAAIDEVLLIPDRAGNGGKALKVKSDGSGYEFGDAGAIDKIKVNNVEVDITDKIANISLGNGLKINNDKSVSIDENITAKKSDLDEVKSDIRDIEDSISSLDSLKQNKTDDSFNTTAKTVSGAINELVSGISNLDTKKQDKLIPGTAISITEQMGSTNDRIEVVYDTGTITTVGSEGNLQVKDVFLSKISPEGNIKHLSDVIPVALADSGNEIADKNWVHTTMATLSGSYITDSEGKAWKSLDDLKEVYEPGKHYDEIKNNDFAYVVTENSSGGSTVTRYRAVVILAEGQEILSEWAEEYSFNSSSFTESEQAALNSGITSEGVTSFNHHIDGLPDPKTMDPDSEGYYELHFTKELWDRLRSVKANANFVQSYIDSEDYIPGYVLIDGEPVQIIGESTDSQSGLMSSSDKAKIDDINEGATKVEDSDDNGKIFINDSEVIVYELTPATEDSIGGVKPDNETLTVEEDGTIKLVDKVSAEYVSGSTNLKAITIGDNTYNIPTGQGTGTVQSITFGEGFTGTRTITTVGTVGLDFDNQIQRKLVSGTNIIIDGNTISSIDTDTTYTLTQDSTDPHKLTFTPSVGNSTIINTADTTYTASNGLKIEGTVIKHTNVLSSGQALEPSFNDATLSVSNISYDDYGHINSALSKRNLFTFGDEFEITPGETGMPPVIHIPFTDSETYGLVKVGSNLNVSEGIISMPDLPLAAQWVKGIAMPGYGLKVDSEGMMDVKPNRYISADLNDGVSNTMFSHVTKFTIPKSAVTEPDLTFTVPYYDSATGTDIPPVEGVFPDAVVYIDANTNSTTINKNNAAERLPEILGDYSKIYHTTIGLDSEGRRVDGTIIFHFSEPLDANLPIIIYS